jgi:hypothetical protein
MSVLINFSTWLAASPLPPLVTSHDWLVPAIQVVHILSVAAVVIASVHINLRALNVIEREAPLADVAARFLPILWSALGILAFTGILLIASEPNRAIFRTVFWIKLALAFAASVATASQRSFALAGAPGQGGSDGRQKLLAAIALILWALTIFAGRWIAYADPWPGAPS